MAETSIDVISRYLHDAVAAEKNSETQLQAFAADAIDPAVRGVFEEHALRTRTQHQRLATRLEGLGAHTSGVTGLLGHLFGLGSKVAHSHPEGQSKVSHDLITAFAVANGELAMYEALANMAEAAGDYDTVALARSIQNEEKAAAESFWRLLPSAVLGSIDQPTKNVTAARARETSL